MALCFKTVGILGTVKHKKVSETLTALLHYLANFELTVLIERETAEHLPHPPLTICERKEIGARCDLLIVVGGDGSLLHAAQTALAHQIPIVGINRGRLGFLTDIHPQHLSALSAILNGDFYLEKRFLLNARISSHGQEIGRGIALNEVALIPDFIPHMTEFEIDINKQFVCNQHSDGVIIATPTGSTAYALSGGGPILHPQLDAIVIVPIFPHSLSMRPIVINGDNTIRIVIAASNQATPRLTCDGQIIVTTPPGSEITITKHTQPLQLIHPRDYDYYENLRSKLHWGHRSHTPHEA